MMLDCHFDFNNLSSRGKSTDTRFKNLRQPGFCELSVTAQGVEKVPEFEVCGVRSTPHTSNSGLFFLWLSSYN